MGVNVLSHGDASSSSIVPVACPSAMLAPTTLVTSTRNV